MDLFIKNFYSARWTKMIESGNSTKFAESYILDLPLEYYLRLLKDYMNEIIDSLVAVTLAQYNVLQEEVIMNAEIAHRAH